MIIVSSFVRNLATREVKIAVVYACCEIRM
jgi:hypothetical protein